MLFIEILTGQGITPLQTSVVDIAFCMKATSNETNAAKTISKPPSDKVILNYIDC